MVTYTGKVSKMAVKGTNEKEQLALWGKEVTIWVLHAIVLIGFLSRFKKNEPNYSPMMLKFRYVLPLAAVQSYDAEVEGI